MRNDLVDNQARMCLRKDMLQSLQMTLKCDDLGSTIGNIRFLYIFP